MLLCVRLSASPVWEQWAALRPWFPDVPRVVRFAFAQLARWCEGGVRTCKLLPSRARNQVSRVLLEAPVSTVICHSIHRKPTDGRTWTFRNGGEVGTGSREDPATEGRV